jgi:3-oxoacyl-[acyl-carrier protein] reductase
MPIHPPPHPRDRVDRLAGKTAVVTGATSGIGRAVAVELASHGGRVVVHGRDAERAQQVCDELGKQYGAEAIPLLADLGDGDACQELVEQAWAWHRIDIWVNVAGVDVLTGPAADLEFSEKLDRLWAVDVRGTILLSRAVGQRMFEERSEQSPGVIVHTGWDQAASGMSGDPGEMFGPIKAAVMAFSNSQAQTLAPRVRVNCVAPGWIQTSWGDDASDYWQQRAVKEALRDRWGTPQDVARVISFVASDDADFLNGQVIPVNGGFRYGCP